MKDENYILFESYLSNEISEDEIAAFELQLKNDEEFKQAFNTYKELSSFLEHKFENEEASAAFKENLKGISDKHFASKETVVEPRQKSKTFSFYKYAIAASVALLIGVFAFNQLSTPSFNDYNSYDAISLTVRGGEDALLKQAEDAFNSKDFTEAEKAFTQLLKGNDSNTELKLYKGIALLELDKFIEADMMLEELSKTSSVYKNKAIWYLALSKLKQKENDACLEVLKTLPEEAEDYTKAQKLIRKLD